MGKTIELEYKVVHIIKLQLDKNVLLTEKSFINVVIWLQNMLKVEKLQKRLMYIPLG